MSSKIFILLSRSLSQNENLLLQYTKSKQTNKNNLRSKAKNFRGQMLAAQGSVDPCHQGPAEVMHSSSVRHSGTFYAHGWKCEVPTGLAHISNKHAKRSDFVSRTSSKLLLILTTFFFNIFI